MKELQAKRADADAPNDSARRGFTLIELSIVLVIIGLIVGGILVGRDLIKAAEIRATISQKDKFDAAVNTFKLKYNCLPGDCASATNFGIGSTAGTYGENGPGLGLLVGPDIQTTINMQANFWYHLAKANLIAFSPSFSGLTYPMPTASNDANWIGATACSTSSAMSYVGGGSPPIHPMSPCLPFAAASQMGFQAGWWVYYGRDPYITGLGTTLVLTASHYWWIAGVLNALGSNSATLYPFDAYSIDAKIDDGLPLSGVVLAASDAGTDFYGAMDPSVSAGGPTNNSCVANATSPSKYNVINRNHTTDNLCALLIRAGF